MNNMAEKYSVSLQKVIDELKLRVVYTPREPEDIMISNNDINRPGLQLKAFTPISTLKKFRYAETRNIAYLQGLSDEARKEAIFTLFSYRFPALIITKDHQAFPEMIDAAKQYEIPILATSLDTSEFMAQIIAFLNLNLAQRITRHGVLIEIYGEGVLIVRRKRSR